MTKVTTAQMYRHFFEEPKLTPDRNSVAMLDKVRSCQAKTAYVSEAAAKKKLEAVRDPGLSLYKCRWCPWFHLGHKGSWQQRKAREEAQ